MLDFARRMERRAERVETVAHEIKKEATLAVLENLTLVTPVDVGTAVSNWQIGIGSPPEGPILAHSPGSHGSTRGANAQEAYVRGKALIESTKPGQQIYLRNAVPYAQRLNEGWSKQAPAGFVERAVMIGNQIIAASKTKL